MFLQGEKYGFTWQNLQELIPAPMYDFTSFSDLVDMWEIGSWNSDIFIRHKMILYLILASCIKLFFLFTRITHSAQLILLYRSMRLYKQKDMHTKIHGKILLCIVKIIYLWHMWHEDENMIWSKGFIVISLGLNCIAYAQCTICTTRFSDSAHNLRLPPKNQGSSTMLTQIDLKNKVWLY